MTVCYTEHTCQNCGGVQRNEYGYYEKPFSTGSCVGIGTGGNCGGQTVLTVWKVDGEKQDISSMEPRKDIDFSLSLEK
jgi:hypothetical protein